MVACHSVGFVSGSAPPSLRPALTLVFTFIYYLPEPMIHSRPVVCQVGWRRSKGSASVEAERPAVDPAAAMSRNKRRPGQRRQERVNRGQGDCHAGRKNSAPTLPSREWQPRGHASTSVCSDSDFCYANQGPEARRDNNRFRASEREESEYEMLSAYIEPSRTLSPSMSPSMHSTKVLLANYVPTSHEAILK